MTSEEMADNEALVIAHWHNARYDGHRVLCDHPTPGATLILSDNSNYPWERSHHLSRPQAFKIAAEATRARLEQIRQAEDGIGMIERQLACQPNEISALQYSADDIGRSQRNVVRWSRILAREQAALAELKRGMKLT